MNATTIEIKLELELDGETVSGRAIDHAGETREFSGWIGLMGLVDSLLDGARPSAHQLEPRKARRTRMLTEDLTTPAASALRTNFPEAVSVAGDADWDAARAAFNLLRDQRPAAVARPRSASEAAAIVAAARDAGLRIAPGLDPQHHPARRARRDADRQARADGRGRATSTPAPHGWRRSPLVGRHPASVGRLRGPARLLARDQRRRLHGRRRDGLLARKHGLQANHVTAVEIVTADGELRRVDADNDPDLFWAVRGGGANFGLVTAIEFDLVPLSELYAGALFFPFERSAEVLNAYREWTANGLPEEITSIGRTLQLPDLEIIPEIVRGKSFSIVEAAYLGGEAQGAELLEPLRELGPVMDTFAMVPPAALAELHMDPVEPVPYASTHAMLGELTERALDEALAAVGPGAGSPVSFEIRHAGGALARRRRPRRDLVVCGRVPDVRRRPGAGPGEPAGAGGGHGPARDGVRARRGRALPQLHRGAPRRQRDVPAGGAERMRQVTWTRPRRPLPRQPRYLGRAERWPASIRGGGHQARRPASSVSFSCR